MSYDLSKALGFEYKAQPVSWTKKDLITYAVGIGATKDDLKFVYELDKSFSAFPTFPVVLNLKGDHTDVTDFGALVSGKGDKVPGLPEFDPNRIVHGSQSIEMVKDLPLEAGAGWMLKRRVVGVHENKSGIIIESEANLVDTNGVVYARMVGSTFNVGAKAMGKPFSKTIASAPRPSKPLPKSPPPPDYVVQEKTTPEQALVYRLSGDYNPLHIDPRIGAKAGFGGVILHGLATYGFAARAVMEQVGGELKAFGVRFTSPVKPGDTIETSIWEMGVREADGLTEVAFVSKNLATGKVCLGNGVAYVKKGPKARL